METQNITFLNYTIGTIKNQSKNYLTFKGYRRCNTEEFLENFYVYKQSDPSDRNLYLMNLYPKKTIVSQSLKDKNVKYNFLIDDNNFKAIAFLKKLKISQLTNIYEYGFTKNEKFIIIEKVDCLLNDHVLKEMKQFQLYSANQKKEEIIKIIQDIALQLGQCLKVLQKHKIALCNLNDNNIGVTYIKDLQGQTIKIIYKIIDFSEAQLFTNGEINSHIQKFNQSESPLKKNEEQNFFLKKDIHSLGIILKTINYYFMIELIPAIKQEINEIENESLRDLVEKMTKDEQPLSIEEVLEHEFLRDKQKQVLQLQDEGIQIV